MRRNFVTVLPGLLSLIVAALGQSCMHSVGPTRPIPSRDCTSWLSLDAGSRLSLALAGCSTLDPETWDMHRVLGTAECTVRDVRVVGKRESGDVLDAFTELQSLSNSKQPVLTLRPEPRVKQVMYGTAAEPTVACDTGLARVYVGSTLLGYLVAYRLDGRELWRVSLPNFQTVIGLPLEDRSPRGLYNLVESDGSVLMSNLVPMDAFLAAAYRVKGRYYELILHRSGVPIALIGPWDGVLAHATRDGWTFDAGGQAAHGSWKLPTEKLAVRLTTTGPEPLIDHFISWNLPHPDDTQWVWRKCDGDNRFGRLDLGKRFDPALDEIAREIHDGLGPDWSRKMFEDDAMTAVLSRGDLPFHDWKARVRAALLDAGADVDCVNYARDHGLLEKAMR